MPNVSANLRGARCRASPPPATHWTGLDAACANDFCKSTVQRVFQAFAATASNAQL
jgi:hypothetical protein